MTIQTQAVELHKRFSTFIDKFNDIGNNLTDASIRSNGCSR